MAITFLLPLFPSFHSSFSSANAVGELGIGVGNVFLIWDFWGYFKMGLKSDVCICAIVCGSM